MDAQPLILTSRLTKNFNGTTALAGVDMEVKRGEIVGLLGPNGAGKTTLINILLGLLTPSSGTARVLGHVPRKEQAFIAPRLNFSSAYVHLPSNLKVIENMTVFADLYGVPGGLQKINSLMVLFEIAHLRDRLTGALSSGEKTRLHLAKCLLNDPELLLLDEPTASLDPSIADSVRKILRSIQRGRKIGILYTSHNMREVEEICDRILFINHGRKVAEGTSAEVMERFRSCSLDEVFIKLVRGSEE